MKTNGSDILLEMEASQKFPKEDPWKFSFSLPCKERLRVLALFSWEKTGGGGGWGV